MQAFSPFAKAYLTRFGRGAISSAQFREYLMTYFAANAAVKDIDWDTWLHAPGECAPRSSHVLHILLPLVPALSTWNTQPSCYIDFCNHWGGTNVL